jgi:2,4-dienoyl-CoA reductase-like NADH-dependent reductase (Old Yellow Enzyme family)
MTHNEIEQLIRSFINAAGRAKSAGFDGVELHGAHGYLISQFVSPFTNRRTDEWGGSFENRFRFVKEIISGIKAEYPEFPLLIKWNSEDFIEGGLLQEESLRMVFEMERLGLDGIEIIGGVFESSQKICRRHIKLPEDEGYFAELAVTLKKNGLEIPIILVGGFRTASVMEKHLEGGVADLIALCRPLIRDPFFPAKLINNPPCRSDCISCNGCLLLKEGITHCTRI